ncbi:MAG: HNH endonuclease [Candidatus Anstonellales archaeon]
MHSLVRQFAEQALERSSKFQNMASLFSKFKIEPPIEISHSSRKTYISDFDINTLYDHASSISQQFPWKKKGLFYFLSISMAHIENTYAYFMVKYNGHFKQVPISAYLNSNGSPKFGFLYACIPNRAKRSNHKHLRSIPKIACACCAATSNSHHNLTLHHIVPVSLKGTNDPANIIVLCKTCHQHIEEVLFQIEKGVLKQKAPFFFLDYLYLLGEYISFINSSPKN